MKFMLSRLNLSQYLPTLSKRPEKTELQIQQERASRRKALKRILFFSAAATGLAGYEIVQDDGDGRLEEPTAYSLDEIVFLLQRSIDGEVLVQEKYGPEFQSLMMGIQQTHEAVENTESDASLSSETMAMADEAMGRAYTTGSNLLTKPLVTTNAIFTSISDATAFSLRYQQPKEECIDGEGPTISTCNNHSIDCNDYAYGICQTLAENNIPPYFLSIWAKNPRKRVHSMGHQMATCKLADGTYVIIDNARQITIWHGSLEEFVDQYRMGAEEVPVSLMPRGIAPYLKPKWNNPAGRFLVHSYNAIDEDEMESVPLKPYPYEKLHIAQLEK